AFHVTGVQTCALRSRVELHVGLLVVRSARPLKPRHLDDVADNLIAPLDDDIYIYVPVAAAEQGQEVIVSHDGEAMLLSRGRNPRSEARRVGTECRLG